MWSQYFNMEVNSISFGAKIGNIPNIKTVAGRKTALCDAKLNGYTAFIGGDVYTPSGMVEKHNLLFKDAKLIAIDDFEEGQLDGLVNYIFLKDKTITPAILDEHIHGGYGVSFHTSSEEEIRNLLKTFAQKGIGGVLATTLPGDLEYIKKQLKVLNNIIKYPDKGSAKILGIHLEGPFMNPEKRGIHPVSAFHEPTVENFEALEPENVKIVTIAPELDKNYELSRHLRKLGINVSAGHSLATAEQVINSGANQVTHLFNAMAPFHHRNPTIANAGLLNPNITAEVNTDFSLLLPETINMILREKPKDKIVLISDALPYAGIKKDFTMNDVRITVDKNWVARDKDGILAGRMQFLFDGVRELLSKTILTFQDFIKCTSENTAKNIGVSDKFILKEGSEPIFSIWNNKTVKHEKTFIN